MNTLDWQDVSQKNSPVKHHDEIQKSLDVTPNSLLGFSMGFVAGLALSLALIGSVVGYTFGQRSVSAMPTSPSVAQVPTPTPTPTPAQQPPTPSQPVPSVDPKTDHIRGDISKAQVAVIEYSDFECPFCKRVEPTMEQITKEYGDKVVIVYRHFPLSFHQNAQKEAEASECANDLGGNMAFWKYHDAILDRTTSNGTGFPLENLVPLAKEIGLNETKFKTCLDSGKFAQHVQDEEASGQAAGVSGTPGNFVVNLKTQKSQEVSGAQPFSAFKAAIDAML